MKFFIRTARHPLFDHIRKEEILEEQKAEPADGKLKKIQVELATTCNKYEQQQDAKNNA